LNACQQGNDLRGLDVPWIQGFDRRIANGAQLARGKDHWHEQDRRPGNCEDSQQRRSIPSRHTASDAEQDDCGKKRNDGEEQMPGVGSSSGI
jgi:hypothetical protein